MNLLMIGKTYLRLKEAELAKLYLTRAREYPVRTEDDKKVGPSILVKFISLDFFKGILIMSKLVHVFKIVHPSIHPCSMGSVPVGAQCPLTPSLGEFLGYRDWFWYPGLSPVLVSSALPFAFHISVFSIHSSSPAIGFHSSIFYGGSICTPPPTLLLIPDLGLALC